MEQRQKDDLLQKLKWQVYNKNLEKINKFQYGCFKFKFNIISQEDQEAFVEFLDNSNCDLMPWNICNFFLSRHIKYSINFRYVKGLSLKGNWTLFKTVMFLKTQKLKMYINNIKIIPSFKKKMNDKKERYELSLQLLNLNTNKVCFIQCDSNIWWKPRKITEKSDTFEGVSYGWLFVQIGKAKFINKGEK